MDDGRTTVDLEVKRLTSSQPSPYETKFSIPSLNQKRRLWTSYVRKRPSRSRWKSCHLIKRACLVADNVVS